MTIPKTNITELAKFLGITPQSVGEGLNSSKWRNKNKKWLNAFIEKKIIELEIFKNNL